MPEMTVTEFSRRGGHARARSMTPEQRQEIARQASLGRAVARVLDNWSMVDPRQRERFRRLLQDPEERDPFQIGADGEPVRLAEAAQ